MSSLSAFFQARLVFWGALLMAALACSPLVREGERGAPAEVIELPAGAPETVEAATITPVEVPPTPEPQLLETVSPTQAPAPAASVGAPTAEGDTSAAEVLFESGFEEADLFPDDDSGWSTVRLQTAPGQPESLWEQSGEVVHSGSSSAKFFAAPGSPERGFTCGKASVIKAGLPLRRGDTVEYRAHFYLTDLSVPVHLMDVECSGECGLQGGPGVRVIMTRDGRLRLNFKFLNWFKNAGLPRPSDAPPDPPKGTHVLPVGKWFELTLRMRLDNGGRGVTEVYVEGELDSRVEGTNIAPEGLEALDRYPQLEVGINCNAEGNRAATTVYVDDVRIVRLVAGE